MEAVAHLITSAFAICLVSGAAWSSYKEDYARAAWRIGFACFMLLAQMA